MTEGGAAIPLGGGVAYGPALNVPIPGATVIATAINAGAAFNINHAIFQFN